MPREANTDKKKICPVCGKEYLAERALTCSKVCHYHYKKNFVKDKVKFCIVCGDQFQASRIDKMCCSKTCGATYAYRKRSGIAISDKYKTKICTSCNNEQPLRNYYKRGKSHYPTCKTCLEEMYPDRFEIEKLKINNLKDIEEFLMKLKRQAYYADQIDMFRLIDLHDRILPTKLIDLDNPIEVLSQQFEDVAFWYKHKKEIIYKKI